MKLYNISLTITDESNNEQMVMLRAPHKTGKDAIELMNMTAGGILVEPEPEIVVTPKPAPRKRRGIKAMMGRRVDPPVHPIDVEDT